jgi:nucleotide-binding universal stress UspA family protein
MDDAANTLQKEAASEGAAVGRRLRRSYEAGHHPKFLVLIDDTDDCSKAVYYASRRAARVGAKVILLRIIDPFPGEVVLLGVADVMRSEAEQEAQELLERYEVLVRNVAEGEPEMVIRQGDAAREIFQLIEADEDIAMLVLAAGASNQGPGPLVSDLARTAGTYPVPIVIVPAHLSEAELDALS